MIAESPALFGRLAQQMETLWSLKSL